MPSSTEGAKSTALTQIRRRAYSTVVVETECRTLPADTRANALPSLAAVWRTWIWQRLLIPLIAAGLSVSSLWGAWTKGPLLSCIVIPFAVALWSVLLRIRTRRALITGIAPVQLAVRSWHALDLLSTTILTMFEVMIATCACAAVLHHGKYIASASTLFLGYIAISAYAQHIANGLAVANRVGARPNTADPSLSTERRE